VADGSSGRRFASPEKALIRTTYKGPRPSRNWKVTDADSSIPKGLRQGRCLLGPKFVNAAARRTEIKQQCFIFAEIEADRRHPHDELCIALAPALVVRLFIRFLERVQFGVTVRGLCVRGRNGQINHDKLRATECANYARRAKKEKTRHSRRAVQVALWSSVQRRLCKSPDALVA
jgi:hypothetical protein